MKTSPLFRFTNDCCFMSSVGNKGFFAIGPWLQYRFSFLVLGAHYDWLRCKTSLLPKEFPVRYIIHQPLTFVSLKNLEFHQIAAFSPKHQLNCS